MISADGRLWIWRRGIHLHDQVSLIVWELLTSYMASNAKIQASRHHGHLKIGCQRLVAERGKKQVISSHRPCPLPPFYSLNHDFVLLSASFAFAAFDAINAASVSLLSILSGWDRNGLAAAGVGQPLILFSPTGNPSAVASREGRSSDLGHLKQLFPWLMGWALASEGLCNLWWHTFGYWDFPLLFLQLQITAFFFKKKV